MLRNTGTRSFTVFRRSLPVLTPTMRPICHIFESPVEGLPTELLQEVFELLDRNSLWSCMRVCGRWYDIARPFFFAVLPVRHGHRQQAFRCLRSHPGLAARVTKLHFLDKSCGDSGSSRGDIPRGPFDIELLVSTLPLLTNLQALCLEGYDCVLRRPCLLSRLLQTPQRRAASLQRLSFEHCSGAASTVPELLSLFSVNTLVFDVRLAGYSLAPRETPVPSPIPPASITIQNLVIGREAYLGDNLSLFERILVPGSLRGLATARCSPLIDHFLQSGACRNLLSVRITVVSEYTGTWHAVVAATDGTAGRRMCEALGAALKHCTRLQYVDLGFIHNGDDRSDLLSQRDALLPVLAHLPRRTLRVFAVNVWLHTPQPWCCTALPVGLDAVDTLAPGPSRRLGGGRGGGFSDLRRVELNVYQDATLPRACTKHAGKYDQWPLPRLYAAELLRYGIGTMDASKPLAEVYWPSDV